LQGYFVDAELNQIMYAVDADRFQGSCLHSFV
jgi:hypothetical protein